MVRYTKTNHVLVNVVPRLLEIKLLLRTPSLTFKTIKREFNSLLKARFYSCFPVISLTGEVKNAIGG